MTSSASACISASVRASGLKGRDEEGADQHLNSKREKGLEICRRRRRGVLFYLPVQRAVCCSEVRSCGSMGRRRRRMQVRWDGAPQEG